MNLGDHKEYLAKYKEALRLRRTKKMTASAIAKMIGVNEGTVCIWLRKNRYKEYLAKYRKALLLGRTKKMTAAAIAKMIGVNEGTVCIWLRENKTYGAVSVRPYHVVKYRRALRLKRSSGGRLSGDAIARKLKLCRRTVFYWLKKEGL